jgi:hypothetical protein
VPGAATAGETADRLGSARGGGEESLTAAAVARLVGGTLAPGGDAERGGGAWRRSTAPGAEDVSFLASRATRRVRATRAGVVLVAPELAAAAGAAGATRDRGREPHDAMLRVLPRLYRRRRGTRACTRRPCSGAASRSAPT